MGNILELRENYLEKKISKEEYIATAYEYHKSLFEYSYLLGKGEISEIRIKNGLVEFYFAEFDFWIVAPPAQRRVAPIESLNFDAYERTETQIMDVFVKNSKVILDIGANIGYFSIRYARVNPKARVHAFEPVPATYDFLTTNISRNNLGLTVKPYCIGLSDHSGSFTFYTEPLNGTNASLLNVSNAENSKKVLSNTLTMDQFCFDRSIEPDFIKCDVEGAEFLVFKGGKSTLMQNTPIVFTELLRKWAKPFGYHPNDVIRFFEELGYQCFGVFEDGCKAIKEVNDHSTETNYIFLSIEKHKTILSNLNDEGLLITNG